MGLDEALVYARDEDERCCARHTAEALSVLADAAAIRAEVADAIRRAIRNLPGITTAARRALMQEIDRAEKST